MNPSSEPPSTPQLPPSPPPTFSMPPAMPALPQALSRQESPRFVFAPMEGPVTLFSTLEHVLKKPGRVLHQLTQGSPMKIAMLLIFISAVSLAVFGLMLGSFSGKTQLWSAPLKIVLGTVGSALICLPSLYIFGSLGGMESGLRQTCCLLLVFVALIGLLLTGFCPVLWVFAQSSSSITFMGILALVFWIIAVCFGLGLVFGAASQVGMHSKGHLVLWAIVFFLVTFQMTSSLRPIIGQSDTFFPSEKKFFLEHWLQNLDRKTDASARSSSASNPAQP